MCGSGSSGLGVQLLSGRVLVTLRSFLPWPRFPTFPIFGCLICKLGKLPAPRLQWSQGTHDTMSDARKWVFNEWELFTQKLTPTQEKT